ncbi:hypothetical protein IHE33_02440 [Mycetohabitans endofungorum]|uniref:hypothetical protein n=1 Tax=Mycetohabitans endofungorum TaxID=417203 RepID=UPI0030D0F035
MHRVTHDTRDERWPRAWPRGECDETDGALAAPIDMKRCVDSGCDATDAKTSTITSIKVLYEGLNARSKERFSSVDSFIAGEKMVQTDLN